ncbi:MAG: Signal recognition particle protein [candidate division TM6 bacterium GW2011_GWF2_32_72]|nr:MAG: Signal recognition particle protein [candidate division TM6 bacterium GW2011_GWF2_32_72]
MFDFLTNKFSSIFSKITGRGSLSKESLDDVVQKVRDALLEADIPYKLVDAFVQDIRQAVESQKIVSSLKPAEQFIKLIHDKLQEFLGGKPATFSFQIPSLIMVMGLQGSGKTTTIAKLALFVKKEAAKKNKNRRILIGSVDFYRPAAVDQLEILSKQVGVDFYRSSQSDPVRAAKDIANYAKQNGYEHLFLDTAGRLHIDSQMLQELREIDANLSPKYKILVLDAMTGQESLNVARAFDQGVGFNSAILSKLDSDTRGGAAFGFRYELKKPITFVGVGEKVEDLQAFYPERMAGRIIGMGDLSSLIEKANEKIDQQDQESAYNSMMSGRMNLQDFSNQLDMVTKIGSLSQIAKYMPGMGNMNIPEEKMAQGEKEMIRFKAIINSMTLKERLMPQLLDGSRRKRIAKGAGVQVEDVNYLLKRFEESQQYVKLFKKFGKLRNFFG